MTKWKGNDLVLAENPQSGKLGLGPDERSMHLYAVGATGAGKSRYLEYLARQDIKNWKHSECGMLLLDPHGSLYDSLLRWLASTSYIYERPVIPIDLRRDDFVLAYNLLRKREKVAPSVVIDNLISSLAYVWGASDTNATPRLERVVATVFQALYETGLTIIETTELLEYVNAELRTTIAGSVKDRSARANLARLNSLRLADYNIETESTLNRFQRISRNRLLRATLGQTDISFDFRKAIEDGAIVLVSLATEGGIVSPENAQTFATLLLADLWTAAKERGKDKADKPFYVYCDEFQRFVSPSIAENLDEARGFGIHLTLANQFPSQIIEASPTYGRRLYDSVIENTRNKVVFNLTTRDRNLTPLAEWLFMGTVNPKRVKHELYSRKVVDYEEQTRTVRGSGSTHGRATGSAEASGSSNVSSHTRTSSGSVDSGGVPSPLPQFWGEGDAQGSGYSEAHSRSASESDSSSESESEVPVWIPIFGEELSNVQFSSVEEQLFLGEQRIMTQPNRHALVRLVGMQAPVELRTPDVSPPRISEEIIEEYRTEQLAKWPFVLPYEEAVKRLEARVKTLALPNTPAREPEPATYRGRRVVRETARVKEETGG